jgi:hypothetical protein
MTLGRKLALIGAFVATVATTKPADAQILTGLLGAGIGTATGGYITLSLVVARAQTGHYLHEMNDLFGLTSFPVLIGAGMGTTVGIVAPDRLWTGFVYGAGGTAVGTGVGWVVGSAISDRPEGKWAGAAIGAGVGMTIGAFWGTFWPRKELLPDEVRETSVIPIGFTIRF